MEPKLIIPLPPVPKPSQSVPKKSIGILILAGLVILARVVFFRLLLSSINNPITFVLHSVAVLPALGVFFCKPTSSLYKISKVLLILECIFAGIGLIFLLFLLIGLSRSHW